MAGPAGVSLMASNETDILQAREIGRPDIRPAEIGQW
jgi:hypothetical protein